MATKKQVDYWLKSLKRTGWLTVPVLDGKWHSTHPKADGWIDWEVNDAGQLVWTGKGPLAEGLRRALDEMPEAGV